MTKYQGGCHCGAVKYEINADIKSVMACNCSICSKRGHLLTFVGEKDFTLKAGEGHLTDYRFNKMKIAHLFCDVCGVGSFGHGAGPDGKKMYAINARCLDGLDLDKLEVKKVDGKSF